MRVGIDIGSISVKLIGLNTKEISYFKVFNHKGRLRETFKEVLEEVRNMHPVSIGITGNFDRSILPQAEVLSSIHALIKGGRYLIPDVRNIIDAGGSSSTLVVLNEKGQIVSCKTNSACAAGTGSFLEHQAKRLEISPEEMGRRCKDCFPPSIATRCAVFAKTDIIHRQQEGFTVEELWHGLCKGVAETLISTLLKGIEIRGKTLLAGGLSMNALFVKWLKAEIRDIDVLDLSPYVQAIGAGLYGTERNLVILNSGLSEREKSETRKRCSLLIKKSEIRAHTHYENFKDENDTEIGVLKDRFNGDIWLGIDVGSTSTKLCAISSDDEIVFHLYRKTRGEPLSAVKYLWEAQKMVMSRIGNVKVRGVGTTGSGRKIIGLLLNADSIINEITAHAKGATFQQEGVETIFEIGGQDSKYMHITNGIPDHMNMNYVCAAGTGSFIEELGALLGFRIEEIGDIVLGIEPPYTSERCTVFMEQDALNLLKKGFSREEVMAGVIYSVALNYLARVVGKRPITGNFIFFQGATARNKGLVSAFETILGRPIFTTDLCHVNGALGVALISRERSVGNQDKAVNFNVLYSNIERTHDICEMCSNHCRITYVKTEEGRETSWGYMCGREPGAEKRKDMETYKAFEARNRMLVEHLKRGEETRGDIWIPSALSTYIFTPFYYNLLSLIGFKPRFSKKTDDEIIKLGDNLSTSDFCLPVKVLVGHIEYIRKRKGKKVFLPYLIRSVKRKCFSNTHLCPYVQGVPGIISSIFRNFDRNEIFVYSPVVDLSAPERVNIEHIYRAFKREGITRRVVERAYKGALESMSSYWKECENLGRKFIRDFKNSKKPTVCIIGRSYNIYDERLSLKIPFIFSTYGVNTIPGEFMQFIENEIPGGFENMFWFNGQNIINSVVQSLKNGFYPVIISNFSCGPDSFILSYIEMICGDTPYLILELDEHSSETGFLTRIEAFIDVIREKEKPSKSVFYIKKNSQMENRKILIPLMHPMGNHFFAAVFRSYGYDAETLPEDTKTSFEIGRKYTRGGECLPMAVTFGNLLKTLRDKEYDPSKVALFMPTSDGPCRFGQYATMQTVLLERMGLKGVSIVSPSASNAYLGLPNEMRVDLWKAILAGDILFKLRCKFKPREGRKGDIARVTRISLDNGVEMFERKKDFIQIIEMFRDNFKKVHLKKKELPLVGVVGEIFVRCNPFSNNYLLETIERCGGEMWLAPISEWIFYTSYNHKWKSLRDREYLEFIRNGIKNRFLQKIEKTAYEIVKDLLHDREEPPIEKVVESALQFLPREHTTEALITIGRAIQFIERDNVAIVVNASPFTCMPGNIANAVFQEIERRYGVPVVSMFYDGEEAMNEKVEIYISSINEKRLSGRW